MIHFVNARKKIEEFSKKTRIKKEIIVDYLFTCLKNYHSEQGKVIQVGNIDSDFTWVELMPQYVRSIGVM